MYIHTHLHTYTHIHIHMYIYIHIHIRVDICIYKNTWYPPFTTKNLRQCSTFALLCQTFWTNHPHLPSKPWDSTTKRYTVPKFCVSRHENFETVHHFCKGQCSTYVSSLAEMLYSPKVFVVGDTKFGDRTAFVWQSRGRLRPQSARESRTMQDWGLQNRR